MRGEHLTRQRLLIAGVLLSALFYLLPWGQQLDMTTYDTLFLLRGTKEVPRDIVFVAIDEASFLQIGERWPWSRKLHAAAIDNMFRMGAETIALDILFTEPASNDEDAALREALAAGHTTVLASDIVTTIDDRFEYESILEPVNTLRTPETLIGHISTPSDNDGFVRRASLFLEDHPSLALQAVRAYAGQRCCDPLPADGFFINYYGGPETLKTVSFYQVLAPGRYLPPDTFRDKLVIVGVNTTNSVMPNRRTPDHYPTPYTRWGGGYMPGALIHANIAANLLNRNAIAFLRPEVVAGAGVIIALVFWRLTIGRRLRVRILAGAALVAGILALAVIAFSYFYQYASPVGLLLPLFAVFIFSPYYDYLEATQERAFMRGALSNYVSPQVVEMLDRDPASLRPGGTRVNATALFLDIAGFTRLTEKNSPEVIVEFVNELLSVAVEYGLDSGGTVERFLGDAAVIIWGAPVAQDDHAIRACETALKIAERIQEISVTASERLGAEVSVRIGINSGTMIAGNIGGRRRFNYTVMGDAVNLAARLEGVNKIYHTTILIGTETRRLVGERFVCRMIDRIRVRGREQISDVWELVGVFGKVPSVRLNCIGEYAAALEHYQAGELGRAERGFARALGFMEDDGPSEVMHRRTQMLAQRRRDNRPWDGIYNLDR